VPGLQYPGCSPWASHSPGSQQGHLPGHTACQPPGTQQGRLQCHAARAAYPRLGAGAVGGGPHAARAAYPRLGAGAVGGGPHAARAAYPRLGAGAVGGGPHAARAAYPRLGAGAVGGGPRGAGACVGVGRSPRHRSLQPGERAVTAGHAAQVARQVPGEPGPCPWLLAPGTCPWLLAPGTWLLAPGTCPWRLGLGPAPWSRGRRVRRSAAEPDTGTEGVHAHAFAQAPSPPVLGPRGRAGQAAAAVAAYERALAVHPLHAEALYNLGVACMELRQLDRAIYMSVSCACGPPLVLDAPRCALPRLAVPFAAPRCAAASARRAAAGRCACGTVLGFGHWREARFVFEPPLQVPGGHSRGP
jgi:hypothetical protein